MSDLLKRIDSLSPQQKKLLKKLAAEKRQVAKPIEEEIVSQSGDPRLSYQQKALWIYKSLNPDCVAYNEAFLVRIEGRLSTNALIQSIERLHARHDTLRTRITIKDGQPVPVVDESISIDLEEDDFSDLEVDKQKAHALELASSFRCRPFDFEKDLPYRFRLVKLGPEKHTLIVANHHIASDDWSKNVFLKELVEGYEALSNGEQPEGASLSIQYSDYASWQHKRIQSGILDAKMDLWEEAWQDGAPAVALPTDRPRGTDFSLEGGRIPLQIDKQTAEAMRKLAKANQTTVFNVALASFYVLLNRYTSQTDLVVGVPYANRPRPELGGLIGFFVNPVAIPVQVNPDSQFRDLLRSIHQQSRRALAAQEVPFDRVVESFEHDRDAGRAPLFQSMFVMKSAPRESFAVDGLTLQIEDLHDGNTAYDLTISLTEIDSGFAGHFEYKKGLYDESTIIRMRGHYLKLLDSILDNADRSISELEMLPNEERKQILNTFNDTQRDHPLQRCLHELFEEQAARTPDAVAVVFGNERMTYRELNAKSNRLAWKLREEHGVGSDVLVGLCLDRSIEMIVGIMGILKAGGAYLPIDPSYPSQRIQFILEDGGVETLLVKESVPSGLSFGGALLDLEEEGSYLLDTGNLPGIGKSSDLAYCIYTSGSTGQPKGVLIEHRSVVNLVWSLADIVYSQYEGKLRVAWVSPYVFDASVQQIFGSLLDGHSLYIVPEQVRLDARSLSLFYADNEIEVIDGTPVHLDLLSNFGKGLVACESLKHCLIGGEALKKNSVRDFLSKFEESPKVTNVYGPTECSVDATFYSIDADELSDGNDIVSIGEPIGNVRIYIIGGNGMPCPLGVSGELCIAGVGLARQYLNRPELTAEKFVPIPFFEGDRMYRTGDLARWLPDGSIEYLGRMDHQVKVRGFRIELGEIEAALLASDLLQEAVVVSKEINGEAELVAYYVADSIVDPDALRNELLETLPEYMAPAYFVALDALPLTANGKINRKALPMPDRSLGSGSEFVAPRNETEKAIAEIWAEVLGLDEVSVLDSFFRLGGHSLKAVSVVGKIQQELKVDLPLRRMFDSPTVEQLAIWVSENGRSESLGIAETESRDFYPVSSQQRRLYALQELEPDSTVYNMPSAYSLDDGVDVEKVRQAVIRLVERHEVLRTSFEIMGNDLVQRVQDDVAVNVEILEVETLEVDAFAERFVKAFDLSVAPLLRVKILREKGGRSILYVDMHHIISDGMSTGILIRDFAHLYGGRSLPPIGLRYRDFAVWQQEAAGRKLIENQADYWRRRFEDDVPVLNLPTDFARSQKQDYAGASFETTIDKETTTKLRRFCRESESTLYMTMLAGYSVLISRYSGADDVVVGNAISGREHSGFENTLGMFVNTLAMRCRPEGDKCWNDYLAELRKDCLDSFENQQYPFEELIDHLDLERDMSRNPLFDTMLVVQNFDADLDSSEFRSVQPHDLPIKTAKFDILVFVWETEEEIRIRIEYAIQLYKEETIKRLAGHLKRALSAAIENPRARLSELSLLGESEHNRILNEFNGAKRAYPFIGCLHDVFEERVRMHPNRVALVEGSESLSYGELNERANRLAWKLVNESSVAAEQIVGVLLDRSIDVIVSILGILKAGGAYLPIDTNYPSERISYLLDDSAACALVTRTNSKIRFSGTVINLDEIDCLDGYGIENLQLETDPSSLAYVIYTSGSTGNPKGVMVEHKSIVNTLNFLEEQYPLGEDDTYLFKTNYTFDVSVSEIFGWFWGGGRLAILPKGDEKDPYAIAAAVKAYNATHINFVPSMMSAFVSAIGNRARDLLDSLKYVFVAGEAFTEHLYQKYTELDLDAKLENIYGPTEASIYASYFGMSSYGGSGLVPIGRPLPNTNAYIVGKANELLPIGAVGELCLSGSGLARGYLNRDRLSSEAFTENPFEPGHLMYRTGDLARWRSDGNIEYLGRIDGQVKVRGFRIELGEIETSLLKYPGLSDVIVVAKELNGNATLVAYYLSENTIERDSLRSHLEARLPQYMVPSYFIRLDVIPRTNSGKVNRKVLPDPDYDVSQAKEYTAPVNEVESDLCEVWQNVLGTQRIGTSDDYFELGGDSIKAIQIVSRVRAKGYSLKVADLFANTTVGALAKVVEAAVEVVDQGIVEGSLAFSPIMRWLMDQDLSEAQHWNQAVMLYREVGFDEKALRATFERLEAHHDSLRLVLNSEKDGLHYVMGRHSLAQFEIDDLRDWDDPKERIEATATEVQSRLSLDKGPFAKAHLFRTANGDHLLIAIHHFAVDGISWRILFEDFGRLYTSQLSGDDVVLPPKTNSFKDWMHALQEYAQSSLLKGEWRYWEELCSKSCIDLPGRHGENAGLQREQGKVKATLNADYSESLLKEASRVYNAEVNDLLLASLELALGEWLGEGTLLLNLEGHGREEIVEGVDVSRTAGWFTSQYPFELNLSNQVSVGDRICEAKERLRRIPSKGIGYGVLRYLSAIDEQERMALNVLPQISFNYLGTFDEDIKRSGIEISEYGVGERIGGDNTLPYGLDINGLLVDGCLSFTIGYDSTRFEKNEMERFARSFEKALREVLEHCRSASVNVRTPSDFGAPWLAINDLQSLTHRLGVSNESIRCVRRLTPLQQGMLYHQLAQPQSGAYVIHTLLEIHGAIHLEKARQAFASTIARHEAVMTRFVAGIGSEPIQVFLNEDAGGFCYEDWSERSVEERILVIEDLMSQERETGFDLEEESPLRFRFIECEENRSMILVTNHHIIMDGWSMPILMRDFLDELASLSEASHPAEIESHSIDKYIRWLDRQDKGSAREFWKSMLQGFDSATRLPFGKSNPVGAAYERETFEVPLGEKLGAELVALSKNLRVTLNSVAQGLWSILLQRYSNSRDVVFGNVISGRPSEVESVEEMVGLFINTIPLRVTSDDGQSFASLVESIQDGFSASERYGYLGLAEVQEQSEVSANLFDHVFVFENFPVDEELLKRREDLGIQVDSVDRREQTNYDFNVLLHQSGEVLKVRFEYNENVYSRDSVERIGEHLTRLAGLVVSNPHRLIEQTSFATEEEHNRILTDFLGAEVDYPLERCLHELFEEQAARTPDAVAAVFGDKELSFDALNRRANRLARLLRESHGVGRDQVVALAMERSLEMIVGILATLKAGGAYLPIDPSYPGDRVAYVLSDSESRVVLTQGRFVDRLEKAPSVLDLEDEALLEGYSDENLSFERSSSDLAYVIYTSGSTGRPKGAMLEHAGAVNRLLWMRDEYGVGPSDVILQKTVYTFDVSVWELLLPGVAGAKLAFLEPGAESDPSAIESALDRHGVTMMHFVPSMLSAFLHWLPEPRRFSTLRRVICSGESLTPAHKELWFGKVLGGVELHNLYGPTEASIDVTCCEIARGDATIPIGRCVPNTRLYILGYGDALSPVGVAGELCIAGVQVGRGYLNQSELTAEKFVDDPFAAGERMYRTGDLARWLADGSIEYLGRIDHQVKVRGFRIELGEVEDALSSVNGIRDTVAAVKNIGGDDVLVAYYTGDQAIGLDVLKQDLGESLPQYMVPSYMMRLDEIPLSANGKADRKALPEPTSNLADTSEYVAPETPIEETLLSIWQELLDVEDMGVKSDFFELGGHSIKAIQLLGRINHRFEADMQVSDLYKAPTIRELAALLQRRSADGGLQKYISDGYEKIEQFRKRLDNDDSVVLPDNYEDVYPMTPIELGMIYSSVMVPEQPIYYDQFVYRFRTGDIGRVADALKRFVDKHEILRTRYYTKAFDEPAKIVVKSLDRLPLSIEDLSELDEEAQASRMNSRQLEIGSRRYEFDGDILWSMHCFRVSEEGYFGVLACHHSVLDGWSVNTLMYELTRMLELSEGDELVAAGRLESSYKDYCALQLGKGESAEAAAFWKDKLSGCARNKLPFNYSGKRKRDSIGMDMVHRLPSPDLLHRLDTLARKNRVSLKSIFLAAQVYMARLASGEREIVTGIVSHDRPSIKDGESILGCFLSTIPVRIELEERVSPIELIGQLHEYLVEVSPYEMHLTDVAKAVGANFGNANPFFDCLLNFTDFAVGERRYASSDLRGLDDDYLKGAIEGQEMTNTLFDLEIDKSFDVLSARIKYSPSYFDREDIEYALDLYIRILERFSKEPSQSISGESLISDEERSFLVNDFNNTETPFSDGVGLHQMFEAMAESRPEAVALRQDGRVMHYRGLNEKANQVARRIREAGVKAGDNVGLISERSFEMIIGMLGILKAGGAYVPVDPTYPLERQAYILSNSSAKIALADSVTMENGSEGLEEYSLLPIREEDSDNGYRKDNLNIELDPTRLAYTIYTSGSTGRPKGVMITHQSAVNLVEWVNKRFDVGESDRLLFVSSMCFDLSVYDIFGMLASGGSVVIATIEQVRDFSSLKSLMINECITFWDSVPTTMDYLVRELEFEQSDFVHSDLRVVFMSGDWIPVSLPNRMKRFFPNAAPISLGGATEATVWSNFYPIEKVEDSWSSIPYGVPIANNYFYIVDDECRLLPPGAVGELCIGGLGVAAGYANDEAKTKAAFVEDPFKAHLGGRMYRTGDLGRMTRQGHMEFLGRKDHQVKIRGYRVELGEIESQLSKWEGIQSAVVAARQDANGNNFLVAYVVGESIQDMNALREYLSSKLPYYMMPSQYVELDELPLTANGKVDRKSLPDPDMLGNSESVFVEPRNETDAKIVSIWREVLGVERIGIDDDFFELGGHSLTAVSVVSRIAKVLGITLNLRDLFESTTVRSLSDRLVQQQSHLKMLVDESEIDESFEMI